MLEKLTKEEFDMYAKSHICNTFYQSSSWGELKALTGWESHLVGIKNNGKIIAATLLLSKQLPIIHKKMFYAPRGFLLDYKDLEMIDSFTQEIKVYVKNNQGIFFKINPYLSYQQRNVNGDILENGINNKEVVNHLKKLGYQHVGLTNDYGKELEPRWISVLDIENQTLEELFSSMRETTRLDIKNSYKHSLKLVEIDETRLPEFKRLMEHTGERRGFADRSLSYYKRMYEVFSKDDNIKIMLVEFDIVACLENLQEEKLQTEKRIEPLKDAKGGKGQRKCIQYQDKLNNINSKIKELQLLPKEKGNSIVVAGGLFMTFGTQVVSLFGASYKEYMRYNAQSFLNYEMIKYAVENGYKTYNFLGITGHFEENHPMYGLFNFKRGFNSNVIELIGEFTYITNPFYYNIYKTMFGLYRKVKRMKVKK